MKYLLVTLLALSSCTLFDSSHEAERVLNEFIAARFSQKLTRTEMSKFIDGEMAKEVESMTDEEYLNFSNLDGYNKTDFQVRTKNCQKHKCVFVYTLNYDQSENGVKKYSTEVKKVVEVVENEAGEWRISKVDNVKTYLNNHEALEVGADN